jgi:hypothetical protein
MDLPALTTLKILLGKLILQMTPKPNGPDAH